MDVTFIVLLILLHRGEAVVSLVVEVADSQLHQLRRKKMILLTMRSYLKILMKKYLGGQHASLTQQSIHYLMSQLPNSIQLLLLNRLRFFPFAKFINC